MLVSPKFRAGHLQNRKMLVSHIPLSNHSGIIVTPPPPPKKERRNTLPCQIFHQIFTKRKKMPVCQYFFQPCWHPPTPPPQKKRRNTLPCQIFHQIFTKRKKMPVCQYFFQPCWHPPTPQKKTPHTNTRTTLDSLKYKAGHLQKNRNKTPVSYIPFSNQLDSQLPAFMLHQSDFEDFCRQSRAKRSDTHQTKRQSFATN